jgi:ubiquinone/menaquinone biosynthesis C-methylase UbiE
VSKPDGSEFDAIASEYDRVRPSYPAALVDAAFDRARLSPGSRVLEIGCGTGQLTEVLVARGQAVDAVDPGAQMIDAARQRVGSGVEFHVGRFEDIDLPAESFDAVFSATAFHWIDPAVGWEKVAGLLKPAGVFALLQSGLPGLSEEEAEAWSAIDPDADDWLARDPHTQWAGAEARLGNISELWTWLVTRDLSRPEAATLFAETRLLTVPVALEFTAETYIAALRTTSGYLRLDAENRATLEERLTAMFDAGGGVRRTVDVAVLVTARRAGVLG